MFQASFKFPNFVADQVLTSSQLNDLVGYLEEQDRLTRTNILGIGMVCGGHVSVNSDATLVTIGKLCGITSKGYLVTKDQLIYTTYKSFDFTDENIYAPFCQQGSEDNDEDGQNDPIPVRRFPILELFPSSVVDGAPLSSSVLNNKVLVAFYELKNIAGQNCNPESCDGLGVTVETTVRMLLIDRNDADTLLAGNYATSDVDSSIFNQLPELNLPRFNSPSTSIASSGEFLAAYKRIFSPTLINGYENAFSALYAYIKPLVETEFEADPFANFSESFAYINNGGLQLSGNLNNLLHIQYIYDLFRDLKDTYSEIKERGFELTGTCCPPDNIFPRHLFAGLFVIDNGTAPAHVELTTTNSYYHNFMPSMVVGGYNKAAEEIVMLFRRLVLQYNRFKLPIVDLTANQADPKLDSSIRITPTIAGYEFLSRKAIPFYYDVPSTIAPRLYQNWNFKLKKTNKNHRNLSYHAASYSNDNDVLSPLNYDLEKYNFFNIEGVVGKFVGDALYNLQTLRRSNRVPFEMTVVMTGDTDEENVEDILNDARRFKNVPKALFADLEQSYWSNVNEIIDRFLKATRVIYDSYSCMTQLSTDTANVVSVVPFLKEAGDNFIVKAKTSGKYFEKYIYPDYKNKPYSSPFKGNPFASMNTTNISDLGVTVWGMFYSPNVVYIMDAIYALIKLDLSDFAENLDDFSERWDDMITLCESLRQFISLSYKEGETSSAMDMALENLEDALFSVQTLGKGYTMRIIGEEYLSRINQYSRSLTFKGFSDAHPGLQHRQGVPMGGTYVMVMHTKAKPVTTAPQPPTGGITILTPRKYSLWDKKLKLQIDAKKAKDLACKDCKTVDFKSSLQATNSLGILGIKQFDTLFMERMRLTFANAVDESVSFEAAFETVKDGVIIADFYLPYLISSEIPPAQFMITMGDSPLFIDLSPRTYMLDGDKTERGVLRYGPPGGTLTIPGYPAVSMGDFSASDYNNDYGPSTAANFDPRLLPAFEGLKTAVTITYTKDTKSVNTIATIFKKPIASFNFTDRNTYSFHPNNTNLKGKYMRVTFVYSGSQNYDQMAWTWGDGTQEMMAKGNGTYTHIFEYTGKTQFSVILTVFNGTYPSAPVVVNVPVPTSYTNNNNNNNNG
ncbi:MAG: hypothetical protein JST49_06575 [Bacteroidetes bacterium]|nr:hypothetical protein [Bacteroidota bacterium]